MEGLSLNTYQSLVSAFCEFLTVAVHTLLAERDLYPKNAFLKARKYGNQAVWQSRHPGVSTWINDAVSAIESEMLKGTVKQASLVIFSQSAVPLERFVFNTARFPYVPEADVQTPFADPNEVQEDVADANSDAVISAEEVNRRTVDLTAQFRGLLSRLCQLSQKLPPLPKHCTFTMAIELRDEPRGKAPIGSKLAFIPSDSSSQNAEPRDRKMTPIRTVDVGSFVMETWVEETQAKVDISNQVQQELSSKVDPQDDESDAYVDPLLEAMEGRTYVR